MPAHNKISSQRGGVSYRCHEPSHSHGWPGVLVTPVAGSGERLQEPPSSQHPQWRPGPRCCRIYIPHCIVILHTLPVFILHCLLIFHMFVSKATAQVFLCDQQRFCFVQFAIGRWYNGWLIEKLSSSPVTFLCENAIFCQQIKARIDEKNSQV